MQRSSGSSWGLFRGILLTKHRTGALQFRTIGTKLLCHVAALWSWLACVPSKVVVKIWVLETFAVSSIIGDKMNCILRFSFINVCMHVQARWHISKCLFHKSDGYSDKAVAEAFHLFWQAAQKPSVMCSTFSCLALPFSNSCCHGLFWHALDCKQSGS